MEYGENQLSFYRKKKKKANFPSNKSFLWLYKALVISKYPYIFATLDTKLFLGIYPIGFKEIKPGIIFLIQIINHLLY
jgi:hypothetical protein